MPFGLMFGALFFFLCAWMGLRLLGAPDATARAAGVPLIGLGLGLAVGLLMRRNWARWGGVAAAAVLVVFALQRVFSAGTALDLLVLLSALAAEALLLLPATGDVRRGAASTLPADAGAFGRALGWVTAISALSFGVAVGWGLGRPAPPREPAVLPAVLTERVSWSDFGSGLERARVEGKLLLVTFIADWCGYCKEMDRTTWKHPSIIERLQELVAVRIDIDDTRERDGLSGAGLAARYRVSGTPTTLLLDADGRELARAGGYQDTREFLMWLDGALRRDSRGQLTVAQP